MHKNTQLMNISTILSRCDDYSGRGCFIETREGQDEDPSRTKYPEGIRLS